MARWGGPSTRASVEGHRIDAVRSVLLDCVLSSYFQAACCYTNRQSFPYGAWVWQTGSDDSDMLIDLLVRHALYGVLCTRGR
jgi:hypothetical protein